MMIYNIMIQGWQWQSEWLVGLGKLASTANLSIIHRSHHSLQIVQISWMGNICLYMLCYIRFIQVVWESYVGKICWNSIRLDSMQMNTCSNYACGVDWSLKLATYAKSSVLLWQFFLFDPIYASFSGTPFFSRQSFCWDRRDILNLA